jgi:hypothetical protein
VSTNIPQRRQLINEELLLPGHLSDLHLLLWSDPVAVLSDVHFKWLIKILIDLTAAAALKEGSFTLAQGVLEGLLAKCLVEYLLQAPAVAYDVRVAACTIGPILHRHRFLSR